MMGSRKFRYGTALLTLALGLAVAVVPLPAVVAPFRPDAIVLVLIYWSLATERRFGLLWALWLGLALDTLSGALLGQHALALLIVMYLVQRFQLQIRVFPASQMTLTIGVLLALYEFVLFWVDGVSGRTVPIAERWGSVASGILLWPLLMLTFDRMRREAEARI
jgi:rod shape-determining protein MreD